MDEFRGEVRPRRQAARHHVQLSAAMHSTQPVNDPFPPISTKQFPAMYIRSPITNMYHQYMRAKTPFHKT